MRKNTQALLFTLLSVLLYGAGAHAQSATTGAKPLVLPRSLQEKMATMKPHHTPLPGAAPGQAVFPKAVADAMKNHASRPPAPPVSEEEKRRMLQEKIRLIMERKRLPGSS